MKILNSLPKNNISENTVVTIGSFDGVHFAHEHLLNRVKEEKKKLGGLSVVISFPTNPKNILAPNTNEFLNLSTATEKIELLKKFEIDILILVTNFYEFFNIEAKDFMTNVLFYKLNAKIIVVGFNHKFGKDKTGDGKLLKEYGDNHNVKTILIDPIYKGNELISSTNIKKQILNYNLVLANRLLGRIYSFSGVVIEGQKIGRTLGFPTANIRPNDNQKLLPSNGVYAVKVRIKKENYLEKLGMMNIGYRPTFEGYDKVLEVNIFDFKEDIYYSEIEIFIYHFVRFETKFNSISDLVIQLEKDKLKILKYFNDELFNA